MDKKKRILNPEQQEAVEHGEGPLMIIAGAGTGKTTVITERIAYLIESGKAKADEILALTFTEKASREMEERVDRVLPYGTPQLWISTFHGFCDRVLRREAIAIGFDPGYRLMSEAETTLFFRKHLFNFDLTYFRPLGNPNKFIAGMIGHFSRLKDEDITPEEYMVWVKKQKKLTTGVTDEVKVELEKYTELAQAYRVYETLKIKEGVVDYSDLISNTLHVFRTRPNILQQYQNQFKYFLIDEFQDTNYAQNSLAILLAGSRKNITVVGDDDQAIYRWRGAAISNILQFKTNFPAAHIVVLNKNYRSTQEILDRSHDLIAHNNPDRLEIVEHIDKTLDSQRRIKGSHISVLYAERVEQEADAVVQAIKERIEESQEVNDGKPGYDYADIAILIRANNHAEPFFRALNHAGIPYQFLGPGQLYRQPEVKDLIAYLKILYAFDDNIAFYRVLCMEWLHLPARDIAAIVSLAKKQGQSFFETCEQIIAAQKQETLLPDLDLRSARDQGPHITETSVQEIRKLIEMIQRHLGMIHKETAGQILYYFLQDTGILAQLAVPSSAKQELYIENIAKFFNRLKTHEAEHEDASIFTVVDWINLSVDMGESPMAADTDWSEKNAVNILTIHASKGLEFPVVFITNLVAARFPTMERKEQIPIPDALIKETLPSGDYHLQEERRLFYVAMTRARDHLFFTAAKYYGEGKREKKLSLFITETVGEVIVEQVIASPLGNAKQLSLLEWAKPVEVAVAKIPHPVTYLSYSQLETFKTCPLQYKYRYILKIPVPPAAALTFGDIVHRTIRQFYEHAIQGTFLTIETLLELYQKTWVSVGFRDKAYEKKMKSHGEELLRGFFIHGHTPGKVPKALEQPFKIRITPTLHMGGKIDRIDELDDGVIEIIDYKTGQAPKGRDVKRDTQLTMYALAATDIGLYRKLPEQVIVSFYFFEGQEKVSGTRTMEQILAAKEDITATAKEIEMSDFTPTPGKHCDFCEFKLICEAWQ